MTTAGRRATVTRRLPARLPRLSAAEFARHPWLATPADDTRIEDSPRIYRPLRCGMEFGEI
jgi:hypothetical protein